MIADNTLITLLIVLSLGLIIPELFKKTRIPFLTLIILAGAIVGPYGLNYVQLDSTISFFGFLGMAFLMFMAGLETNIVDLYKSKYKIFLMALLNSLIPFSFGLFITRVFGYSWDTSILVGIIFISSSVAVITSFLKDGKSVSKNVSQLILSAVMVTDIVSLVALGFILQNTSKITTLPLPLYLIILIFSIIVLLRIMPSLIKRIVKKRFFQDYGHERRLRLVIVILVGVVAYFSFLGAHPILASFLAGLSLSSVVLYEKSDVLKHKLNAIGYGLFIPIFFFVVGMDIDISLLKNFDIKNVFMVLLILGLIFSKIFSGYIAGRIVKLKKKEALLFGSISITQLTTTLAVTYAAASSNLLDSVLVTSIIFLAVITTIVGPILSSYIIRKTKSSSIKEVVLNK
jgi:Kef-type K+ transport system membrane component KefB